MDENNILQKIEDQYEEHTEFMKQWRERILETLKKEDE